MIVFESIGIPLEFPFRSVAGTSLTAPRCEGHVWRSPTNSPRVVAITNLSPQASHDTWRRMYMMEIEPCHLPQPNIWLNNACSTVQLLQNQTLFQTTYLCLFQKLQLRWPPMQVSVCCSPLRSVCSAARPKPSNTSEMQRSRASRGSRNCCTNWTFFV